MRTREFNRWYKQHHRLAAWLARRLTRNCPQFEEDVYQEGLLRVAQLTIPPSCPPHTRDTYCAQAAKFAMIDAVRRLRPERTLAFSEAWALGFELTRDCAGRPVMYRTGGRSRRGLPEGFHEYTTQRFRRPA